MKTEITQDNVSEWAKSVADLSEQLAHQITNHTTDSRDLESTLLYLKLIRHSTLMRDVSRIILMNPKQRLSNSFILLRCMLEDFITLYFLKTNNYNREFIIKYVAEGIHNRIKMMEETAALNQRFYKGSLDGMISFDYVQKEKDRIKCNSENNELFIDKQQFKLKRFPTPREMIKALPINDSTIANVPSIISWIQYSEYVHHSIISARQDSDIAMNNLQIKQLRGTLLYAFKLVELVKERLIQRHFPINLVFNEKLDIDLRANTIDGEELWDQINA